MRTSILSALLDLVAYNFKMTCGLGAEEGEFLEDTKFRVNFYYS